MEGLLDRIEVNLRVMGSKPVIRGTRVAVEAILRRLAEGLSVEEIPRDYLYLSIEDIKATLICAVKML